MTSADAGLRPQSKSHLPYIDVARGIAILLVVMTHTAVRIEARSTAAELLGSYSQMGVQLFFIASAFTLCLSMSVRSASQTNFGYFCRRFFRIAPLYYIGIPVYVVWRYLKDRYVGQETATPAIFETRNILENFTFLFDLDPTAQNVVVPGGWSISVEMMFYVLFPWMYSKMRNVSERNVWYFAAFSVAFNLIFQWTVLATRVGHITNDNYYYFLIVNQMPVFVIGVAHYMSKDVRSSFVFEMLLVVLMTVLALVLWKTEWPLVFAFIPAISAISFIYLLRLLSRLDVFSKAFSLISAVGRVSFSMYLWHFIVVDLVIYALHRRAHFLSNRPDAEILFLYILICLLSYGVAKGSYAFVERRGIRYGHALASLVEARANRHLTAST